MEGQVGGGRGGGKEKEGGGAGEGRKKGGGAGRKQCQDQSPITSIAANSKMPASQHNIL
jgi:hypothetical protein